MPFPEISLINSHKTNIVFSIPSQKDLLVLTHRKVWYFNRYFTGGKVPSCYSCFSFLVFSTKSKSTKFYVKFYILVLEPQAFGRPGKENSKPGSVRSRNLKMRKPKISKIAIPFFFQNQRPKFFVISLLHMSRYTDSANLGRFRFVCIKIWPPVVNLWPSWLCAIFCHSWRFSHKFHHLQNILKNFQLSSFNLS